MQVLRLAYKFLLYRLKSFRLHGVHSPFVFDLYQQVICHNGFYQAYDIVENLRRQHLKNHEQIAVTDFGAGSRTGKTKTRSVSSIAQTAAKPAKYARLLFRLANYYQPGNMVELGTSLGLTTAYLAKARPQVPVYTLEGCPNITAQAQANFKSLKLTNIQVVTGNIDQTLTQVLNQLSTVDFVFFDGNHRYEPTIRYFKACLAQSHENSIFVFDDIYWSAEMERAWQDIIKHPAVTISIDLFQVGLVFFRRKQPKQHFTLWY